jgi:hypothetical protein
LQWDEFPEKSGESLGLNHFTAAQAGRAHAHAFGGGAHPRMNWAQIDVPTPLSHVMGVADAVSSLRLFAADITLLCHDHSRKLQNSDAKHRFYRRLDDFGKVARFRQL